MNAAAVTWFVVADGARLRIVRRDGVAGAFRTVSEARSKTSRRRSSDLGTERPGRVFESASSTRHGAGEREDLHRQAKRGFAEAIADDLNASGRRGEFDALVLVAPTRVLGDIRGHLAADIAGRVVGEVAKDLTRVPDAGLTPHLDSVGVGRKRRGAAEAPGSGGEAAPAKSADLGDRLQITFRNMESSPALSARIRKEADRLSRHFDRITSCHVIVEAPHRHKTKGRVYNVRIDLHLPRKGKVIANASAQDHAHEDVYVAVRDAFDATARRLDDQARRLRGEVKERRYIRSED